MRVLRGTISVSINGATDQPCMLLMQLGILWFVNDNRLEIYSIMLKPCTCKHLLDNITRLYLEIEFDATI